MLSDFLAQVRFIFVLLLLATILVVLINHQPAIQNFSETKIASLKKSPTSEGFKENALKHENEVNSINK